MSDKIDWRTLKAGEHVTVTFDAVVSDIHDGLWVIAEGSPAMPTRFLVAEADKATITKKEQPLKVGDRVLVDGEECDVVAPERHWKNGDGVPEVCVWSNLRGYRNVDAPLAVRIPQDA